MTEAERLLGEMEAAVQAAEFSRLEKLARELVPALKRSPAGSAAAGPALVRLQQILSLAKAARGRLQSEATTLERCNSYLSQDRERGRKLVLTA